MNLPPPLILVDGSSYLFRAYHALPSLTNSKGEATGAIVGVVNMLRKLIAEYRPERMAVVFDAPGGSFRNELYAEYKANREQMPDDLREQIAPLHAIVKAMGVPLLMVSGVEADDVIGTLATQAATLGMETLISTGDKDLAQLVNGQVTLINTMNDVRTDREGVRERFGVEPEQVVDYLALVGDTSDNIPGVPKCGPKTAARWLSDYQTLDNLIERADEIPGKVGENLRGCLDQLPLARELATIKRDLALDLGPAELTLGVPQQETLRSLYSHIESRRLLDSLDSGETPAVNQAQALAGEYETLLDWERFLVWLERLQDAALFAIDTETTSLDYMEADIVGVSFAVEPGRAAYVPVGHRYPGLPLNWTETGC